MRRESLIPFLPAALAAVTDVLTACVVTAHQKCSGPVSKSRTRTVHFR
jgi:hypothetical protein